MAESTRTRLTAAERSEQVLAAAVTAFAETGYAATKTDEIARLAGVSQPYVIRLFGTKERLFVAAVNQACGRIEEVFRAARSDAPANATAQEALQALGKGYETFLAERELPLLLLHGFSASADPAIGDNVRERFGRIYDLVRELAGADADDARRFMATGMLITVMTAMQVIGPDAVPTRWAEEINACLQDD
ncbi:TetR/AcrR family transcriptional regulator [Nocardia cerradoensis]|uniref:TetR/AcrR family transcriptional regulator n=1 Tax=Nocardia cerradoensis TaxID=85688 RepID=UPI0002E3D317|nr:TetR/AcrR family transcriptional regulator [Nocardia cerradoensis]NKY44011.1 TetR/AcrR family transcriptional regulator [Nocardia cerradoensis]